MWFEKKLMRGVLFFYKQMFFSNTLIGVSIVTLGGEFRSNLVSYLFYKFISVVSIIFLYHMYGGWFTDGWLGKG